MFTRNLRVSLIEDKIAFADPEANMQQLWRNLRNVPDDTDLVVLPELFTTGFVTPHDQAAQVAQRNIDGTITQLHKWADELHVAFAGSFLARTADMLFNRGFFIEPGGEETFYDKRHLFTFSGEDHVFKQGFKLAPVIRYRGFNIKLIVCYDLRFPVFCRNRLGQDYDLLLVVGNWAQSRQRAWKQLLLARAVENQAYVCGVNRSGTDPEGTDYGEASSFVIDFKGNILAERGTSPIIAADLSPAALQRFREKFPAWRDADDFSLKI